MIFLQWQTTTGHIICTRTLSGILCICSITIAAWLQVHEWHLQKTEAIRLQQQLAEAARADAEQEQMIREQKEKMHRQQQKAKVLLHFTASCIYYICCIQCFDVLELEPTTAKWRYATKLLCANEDTRVSELSVEDASLCGHPRSCFPLCPIWLETTTCDAPGDSVSLWCGLTCGSTHPPGACMLWMMSALTLSRHHEKHLICKSVQLLLSTDGSLDTSGNHWLPV